MQPRRTTRASDMLRHVGALLYVYDSLLRIIACVSKASLSRALHVLPRGLTPLPEKSFDFCSCVRPVAAQPPDKHLKQGARQVVASGGELP